MMPPLLLYWPSVVAVQPPVPLRWPPVLAVSQGLAEVVGRDGPVKVDSPMTLGGTVAVQPAGSGAEVGGNDGSGPAQLSQLSSLLLCPPDCDCYFDQKAVKGELQQLRDEDLFEAGGGRNGGCAEGQGAGSAGAGRWCCALLIGWHRGCMCCAAASSQPAAVATSLEAGIHLSKKRQLPGGYPWLLCELFQTHVTHMSTPGSVRR